MSHSDRKAAPFDFPVEACYGQGSDAWAVAFSRNGDPASGDFQDAGVIQRFGEVPDANAPLSG